VISLAAGFGNMASYSVTSAGLALAVGILAIEHARWWGIGKGGGSAATAGAAPGGKAKDPKELIPFWFGMAFGTLMVACPAGILGYASGFLRWGGNGIGGLIMSWMTGQKATTIASSSAPRLDQNGAIVVTVLVVVLFALRKQFPKGPQGSKGKFKKGAFCGVLLAISTGIFAFVGNLVVPSANQVGAWAITSIATFDLGSLV
jgi:hypothetical protein